MLEFGIFDHLERQQAIPLAQQFRERLDLLALADRLGFWGYHLAEHHNAPLSVAPSQNVFLAAAAQRTSRIVLCPLVYCLPLYHPLRLVEEVAMLDAISGGRLQIGVGRGISALEHRFFGVEAAEAPARFGEELRILVDGLSHDRLTFHGKYYGFDDVPMVIRPTQHPYPPIWYPGNVEFAAANGFHFLGGGPIRNLPGLAAKYRQTWETHAADSGGLNPHVSEPMVGTVRVVLVAESDAEARRIADRAFPARAANWAKPGYNEQGGAGSGEAGNTRLHPSFGGDVEFAMKVEGLVAGSPATVRSFVERYAAESDMNYFVGAFQWGDLTHDEAAQSLQLFATEVMPAVRPVARK